MQLTPRKRLFVDRDIQGALMTRIAVYWCFSVLVVCLIMLCARAITHPEDSFFGFFAFGEFFARYGAVVVTSAVLVPLIMYDVLVLSNRFVGPLVRLRRSMRALGRGEHVQPIKFREKDFWPDVAEEFNQVAAYVEQLQQELAEAKGSRNEPHDAQPATHP